MEIKKVIILIMTGLLVNCGGAKHNSKALDNVSKITDKDFITYKDIRPLLEQKCSLCHNANSGLFNVLDYDTALSKIEAINNRVVVIKDMPSSGTMTEAERDIISRWVEDGGLKGGSMEGPSPEKELPPEEEPPSVISFSETILPLFEMKCSLCHNANSNVFNVLDYTKVITKLDAVKNRVVVIKDMPQVATMSDEERAIVEMWIEQGAEE